ncbi:hypothetical protein ACERIT_06005 [Halopenitus sp. H-Gu1]|jgi:DNA-binding MarR family transcriptional regulator|uniref:hypothetical protein n=1 Tax=Halopenitus sp. H-Gu1 TaxID=3242697 RepID=UPI00359E7BBE
MRSTTHGHDPFESLPPSCQCVRLAFEKNGTDQLSRQELLRETNLSESALDDALERLETRDLLIRTRKFDDLTQVVAELRQSPNC